MVVEDGALAGPVPLEFVAVTVTVIGTPFAVLAKVKGLEAPLTTCPVEARAV